MTGPMLVFGAAGQIGRELMVLSAARRAEAIGLTRQDLDARDASAVDAVVARAKPRFVVNCAAYTAVDQAESEPELAEACNRDMAGVIARAAAQKGVPILHLSTDYVFDGSKIGAYTEDDAIRPLGVYGRTKAAGEASVREIAAQHLILRTAWVFGTHGKNFLKTILRLAGERDRLRVVADQRGTPTATPDIAEAILAVDAAFAEGEIQSGTFHFGGAGETTWHGFAEAIVAAQARRTGRRPPVDPIGTADYPTPAMRPANSALESTRFATTFGYRAQHWQERTAQIVDQLLAS